MKIDLKALAKGRGPGPVAIRLALPFAFFASCAGFLRNRNYHTNHDDPSKLDYIKMARVVDGLGEVARELAGRK